MKKAYVILPILFAAISCTNKKEEPIVTNNKPNDTSTIVRSERTVNPYATVDVSPMDMTYFPVEYPKLKMSKVTSDGAKARVIYSRPHLQGRTLFKDLLKYYDPWRLGANEATELDLYSDATIQDQKVKAGRYIMYCIPQPETWTIILNSNVDTWGLEQDASKDVIRFTVPVKNTGRRIEYYTMVFEQTKRGADLVMAWDVWELRLPFQFD